VGVHDLQHDGKLFWDRSEFARKAKRINSYLSDWGASGFRSAFMHHNLDWVHDLEILYDASTFDTDPFEPQPDGVNTIFPVLDADGPTGRGYVELPYTLPQDSTLFLLLKESSPEIWKRKLDWIVECGGMALVNVHPDYINFDEGTNRARTLFPTRIIRSSWNTSRRSTRISTGTRCPVTWPNSARFGRPDDRWRSGRRVCMLTHSIYESDNRVMRYAEALAERGDEVDVYVREAGRHQPDTETINQVQVHRVHRRSQQARQGADGLSAAASAVLGQLHRRG
jgi:hypothetical protein